MTKPVAGNTWLSKCTAACDSVIFHPVISEFYVTSGVNQY